MGHEVQGGIIKVETVVGLLLNFIITDKSIKAETFISGFVCPFCWSTKNDCPCPEKELRTGIETQFASAGSLVQHGSATRGKGLSIF